MGNSFRPDIVATPLHDGAIHVVVNGRGTRWSYVADVPRSDRAPVGPHPLALALGGWAACTVMTSVGVAYRGNVALDDIGVTLQVEATDGVDGLGFGVRESVRLRGTFSEADLARMHRAVSYCPVSQLFTKGALQTVDEVVAESQPAATELAGPPVTTVGWEVAPTVVEGRYLSDTKEYVDGRMSQEGEAKVYVTADNPAAAGRWMLLSGHTSVPWIPHPVPLALAGLAASTLSTLQATFGAASPAPLRVEFASPPSPGAKVSQEAAASGAINRRELVRRVVVGGALSASLEQEIRAALDRDPLYQIFKRGDALLSVDVSVG